MTREMPEWADKLIGFDLETTGVDVDTARIVSAAVVDYDDGRHEDTVTWEVDPGIEIPEEASIVHGVWDHQRTGRQDHDTAVLEIVEELWDAWGAGYTVAVFNAPFDLTILQNLAREAGAEFTIGGNVIDALVVDRYLDPYRKGRRSLSAACQFYGVDLDNAHTAEADANASVGVSLKVAERWPGELAGETLMERQAEWSRENDKGLVLWMRKQGRPLKGLRTGWPVRDPRSRV